MTPYYADESVTLWLGDCREVAAWLDADVLITDPPYGISLCDRSGKNRGNSPVILGEVFTRQSSDRIIPREHVALRDEALSMWGSTRPALVFGSWRAPRPHGTQMRLVWDKGIPGLGGVGPWRQSDEEIYVINWPNPKFASRPYGTVIRHPPCPATREHPTSKPVGLIGRLMKECPPGVVADPFAGSGSTAEAARLTGRKAVLIEADERYCEIIARRMSQGILPEVTA